LGLTAGFGSPSAVGLWLALGFGACFDFEPGSGAGVEADSVGSTSVDICDSCAISRNRDPENDKAIRISKYLYYVFQVVIDLLYYILKIFARSLRHEFENN
jgi:hypothetical protein